jgi:hypothetical protein
MNKTGYCIPWNAGLASETPAVQRRLERLLHTLSQEINDNIVQGPIAEEVRQFRINLIEKLRADGWEVYYPPINGNKMRVRAPKAPRSRKKDPDSVPGGKLPADWRCPTCKADRVGATVDNPRVTCRNGHDSL